MKNDGLLGRIYPIGSIYMSTNDISPEDFLGGTWERWAQGRVPVGVDESDEELEKPNLAGGEKKHTLTQEEIAGTFWHTGEMSRDSINVAFNAGSNYGIHSNPNVYNGDAHNNMQPYITCYMWKRTA